MPPSSPTRKKQKLFKSPVKLTTTTGDTHIVTLSGPESAVKTVAALISLGVEAQEVGFGPGDITLIAEKVKSLQAPLWRPN